MEEKEGSPGGGGGVIIFLFYFIFFKGWHLGWEYILKPPFRDADDSHNSICTYDTIQHKLARFSLLRSRG